jgi:hypothetical protein
LVYKKEGWVPHLGKIFNTQKYFNSTSPSPETWDFTLSHLFVTPTANFRAGNTSNLELDVGTFSLN